MSTTLKKLGILIVIVVVAAGVWFAQTQKTKHDVVRIGFLPVLSSVPFFAAEQEGFFTREGVNVESYRFSNANQLSDALLGGQVDAAIVVGYPTLLPLFQKEPNAFRVVQSYVETKDRPVSRILVLSGSSIQKIEDLKGKSIGTYTGLTQKVNVSLILAHFFKNPDDVQLVQVDESLQIPSLVAGRFDALFAIEPITTVALKKEPVRSISDSPRTQYVIDPFPGAATLFSTTFMKDQPELASRTLRALEAAGAWIEQHPREAALTAANPQYTQLTADIAGSAQLYTTWDLGKEDRTVIQKFADILLKNGVLKSPLQTEGVFAKREDFR